MAEFLAAPAPGAPPPEDVAYVNARLIDAASGRDESGALLTRGSKIAELGPGLFADGVPEGIEVVDCGGHCLAPGLVDMHVHLREPGHEHKETLASGGQAAAAGGVTTMACMPNTAPVIDDIALVQFIERRARETSIVRVHPIAALTKGLGGEQLTEMGMLCEAGAVAFSDDGAPVTDAALMRRALEYAGMLGTPVIDHPEEPALAAGAVMHEGWVSTRLGLRGVPAAAEESFVARDIALAETTGARVHLAHISTAGSVELVRAAKGRGLPVTAEVTPHHLTLTHEAVLTGPSAQRVRRNGGPLAYDTNAKVNPPLRSAADVAACVEALREGVIDAIATDHAPHADYEKACEFDEAAYGISGLETAFGLCMTLVHSGALELPTLIERLTAGPVRALGLERSVPGLGSLAEGAPGDIVLLDPEAEWTVEPERFASKGRNTPLAGRTLKGEVVATVYSGEVVWAQEKMAG